MELSRARRPKQQEVRPILDHAAAGGRSVLAKATVGLLLGATCSSGAFPACAATSGRSATARLPSLSGPADSLSARGRSSRPAALVTRAEAPHGPSCGDHGAGGGSDEGERVEDAHRRRAVAFQALRRTALLSSRGEYPKKGERVNEPSARSKRPSLALNERPLSRSRRADRILRQKVILAARAQARAVRAARRRPAADQAGAGPTRGVHRIDAVIRTFAASRRRRATDVPRLARVRRVSFSARRGGAAILSHARGDRPAAAGARARSARVFTRARGRSRRRSPRARAGDGHVRPRRQRRVRRRALDVVARDDAEDDDAAPARPLSFLRRLLRACICAAVRSVRARASLQLASASRRGVGGVGRAAHRASAARRAPRTVSAPAPQHQRASRASWRSVARGRARRALVRRDDGVGPAAAVRSPRRRAGAGRSARGRGARMRASTARRAPPPEAGERDPDARALCPLRRPEGIHAARPLERLPRGVTRRNLPPCYAPGGLRREVRPGNARDAGARRQTACSGSRPSN